MTWAYSPEMSPQPARLSLPALMLTGFIHIALLWLLLQSAPVVLTVRQVVQYLAPITLLREKPPTPSAKPKKITAPAAVQPVKPLAEPVLPIPMVPVPKAIELLTEKPVQLKSPPVVPTPPIPVPQEVVVPPPPPTPLPVLPPKPELVPVAEPLPTPTPVPVPVPVPPPIPAAAPAPIAAPARPAAITPVEQVPASSPPPAGPGGAQAAPAAAKPLTGLYPNMYNPSRQRSLAELANEQLNGGRRRDKLAEGVGAAEIPDCIRPNPGGSLVGLVTIPFAAATGKCK